MNANYEDSPVWVKGDLYIGGTGLSTGYCNDQERTHAHFIYHPITGARIYKTGDLARYLPDGNIEFLGREDQQIKMNGHRVELGDIEANLCKLPIVQQAAVIMQDNKLIGHLKLHKGIQHDLVETMTTDTKLSISLETIKNELEHMKPTLPMTELSDYTAAIEWLSVGTMFLDLSVLNIFKNQGQVLMKAEIIGAVANTYESLIGHWLDYLVEYGFIERKQASYIVNFSKEDALQYMNNQLNDFHLGETQPIFQQLKEQLIASQEARLAILKGEQLAKIYLVDSQGFLTPEQLGHYNLWSQYTQDLVNNMISILSKSNEEQGLNVLELGTRTGQGSHQFAQHFSSSGQYTYADESSDFLHRKKAAATHEHVKFKQYDVNLPPDNQDMDLHTYDLIIAENTLHRSRHLNNTMTYLKRLLKPDGLMILTENVKNNALLLITVAFYEEGYQQLADARKVEKLPLLDCETWQQLWKDEGFNYLLEWPRDDVKWFGEYIMMVEGPSNIQRLDLVQFKEEVEQTLPKYMCPDDYFVHESFPVTANGKINRKQLAHYKISYQTELVEQGRQAVTLEEQTIVQAWKEILETAYSSVDDNFFEHGGDSLKAIRFINRLSELGYTLTLEKLFLHPTIEGMAAHLVAQKNDQNKEEAHVIGTL